MKQLYHSLLYKSDIYGANSLFTYNIRVVFVYNIAALWNPLHKPVAKLCPLFARILSGSFVNLSPSVVQEQTEGPRLTELSHVQFSTYTVSSTKSVKIEI